MSKYVHFAILTSAFMLCACAKASNNKSINTPITSDTSFYAKGADIGWLSQMESEGKKFYDAAGKQMDCIALLKRHQFHSIKGMGKPLDHLLWH
jgi:arabinogalactan endo-1,4-beta-galactosidase